jgi:branched-chain amino acid transport system substrate-binding protein
MWMSTAAFPPWASVWSGSRESEGAVFPTGYSPADPRLAPYNASSQSPHKVPCENAAYYALDAVMALEYAFRVSFEKTGRITPAVMQGALENMKDVAEFTGKLTMDPGTHNPRNRPVLVMTLKDGKPLLLKAYPPG